jgi:hypothetical protein
LSPEEQGALVVVSRQIWSPVPPSPASGSGKQQSDVVEHLMNVGTQTADGVLPQPWGPQ